MFDSSIQYRLSLCQRICYGVGHVLNDLCAILWYTYLLIFYTKVLEMSNVMAGSLIFIGQVIDAICTPLISYDAYRMARWCGYSKRKCLHLLGIFCVVVGFCFLYMPQLGMPPKYFSLGEYYEMSLMLYYSPVIVIYQFGWALCQVTYVAIIPSLTDNMEEKVELNFIRHSFMVASHLLVFVMAWVLLAVDTSGSQGLTTADYRALQMLVLCALGVGIIAMVAFHSGTKEVLRDQDEFHWIALRSIRLQRNIMLWLKNPQFYLVTSLYVSTRLIINIIQVYMSLYIIECLHLADVYIAVIPIIMCACGFITTYPGRFLSLHLGKRSVYTIGLLCIIGASVWFYLLDDSIHTVMYQVLGAATLTGIGESTILMLSLTLTADFIEQDQDGAAFVYGSLDVLAKLSTGVAVLVIQSIYPSTAPGSYYRYVIALVPIPLAVISFNALLLVRRPRPEEPEAEHAVYDTLRRSSQWTTYGTMKEDMFDHFSTTLTDTVEESYDMSSSYHISRDYHSSNPVLSRGYSSSNPPLSRGYSSASSLLSKGQHSSPNSQLSKGNNSSPREDVGDDSCSD